MKAACLFCLASGKCGNLLSKENRTKNERDSKLEGIAQFNVESSSTLINMMVRNPGQSSGASFGWWPSALTWDRNSLYNAAVEGEKTKKKGSFGGRVSRGSCMQLLPWIELGELCS